MKARRFGSIHNLHGIWILSASTNNNIFLTQLVLSSKRFTSCELEDDDDVTDEDTVAAEDAW